MRSLLTGNARVTNHFTMNTTFMLGCLSRLAAALKTTIFDKQPCAVSQCEERTNCQDGKAPSTVYTRPTNHVACYTTASKAEGGGGSGGGWEDRWLVGTELRACDRERELPLERREQWALKLKQ